MSDGIAHVLATAGVAHAAFGEIGGGIASRLQSALGLELARARTDAQFAAAAVTPSSLTGATEWRAEASRAWPSLAGESVQAGRDTRTRGFERRRDDRSGQDRSGEDRDGEPEEPARDEEQGTGRCELPRWQLVAIERAVQAAGEAALEVGCNGSLHGLVLPGEIAPHEVGVPVCTVFVLCTAFDGDLGATRRVWGFGYGDDVLVATLDGVRVEADADGDAPGRWTVEQTRSCLGARSGTVTLVRGSARWSGLSIACDVREPMPACWSFHSTAGPVPC